MVWIFSFLGICGIFHIYPPPLESILIPYLSIIVIGIGLILILFGIKREIPLWRELNIYITKNISRFPETIREKAIKGLYYMKIAGILLIFTLLIIPLVFTAILRIFGHIKLCSLRKLPNTPDRPKEPLSSGGGMVN